MTTEMQIDTVNFGGKPGVQQPTNQSSTLASSSLQSPQAQVINNDFEHTGKVTNIHWFIKKATDVLAFRNYIRDAVADLGEGPLFKKWCTMIVIRDISSDQLVFSFLGHQEEDEHPVIANLLYFPQTRNVQNKKYTSLMTEALDGPDPLKNESVVTERSVIISLGNHQPDVNDQNSFHFKLLKEMLAQTDFRVSQILSIDEWDHFCGRFHGKLSQVFVTAEQLVYPPVTQIPGKEYRELTGLDLTRQFYAKN